MVSIKTYALVDGRGYEELQGDKETVPSTIDSTEEWEEFKQLKISDFLQKFHFAGVYKDNLPNRLKGRVGRPFLHTGITSKLIFKDEDDVIERIAENQYKDDIRRFNAESERILESKSEGRERIATFSRDFFDKVGPDIPTGLKATRTGNIVVLEGD